MTSTGFLFTFMAFVVFICIAVVVTVVSTVASSVAGIVDDEAGEEE